MTEQMTAFLVFVCNVLEGLGFAAIVFAFGMLIRRSHHEQREQETTTYWVAGQPISRREYTHLKRSEEHHAQDDR